MLEVLEVGPLTGSLSRPFTFWSKVLPLSVDNYWPYEKLRLVCCESYLVNHGASNYYVSWATHLPHKTALHCPKCILYMDLSLIESAKAHVSHTGSNDLHECFWPSLFLSLAFDLQPVMMSSGIVLCSHLTREGNTGPGFISESVLTYSKFSS